MAEKEISVIDMELNKALFYKLILEATSGEHERYNIGTYKEKTLHLILKRYFEEDEQYHEIPTNGFIADIKHGDTITEIETSSLSGLNPKLEAYLPEYKVRLVYPLAAVKYVSWIDPETGTISKRNKARKKTTVYNALFELVRILPYVNDKNLTLLVPLLEIDEYRMLDGWSHDKKRGSNRFDRIPSDILGIESFSANADYERYIPGSCVENFTIKDFAEEAKVDTEVIRGVTRVFLERGLIEKTGKKGNTVLYSRKIESSDR